MVRVLQVLDPHQSQVLRRQMDAATDQLLQRHMLAGSAVGTDWCALAGSQTPACYVCCLRLSLSNTQLVR